MALETIIAVVAVAATVASTAYSVVSSVEAGHEARTEAHKAEWGAALNAEKAKAEAAADAGEIRRRAAVDIEEEHERRRKILSAQRSIYGASGLQMEGSPLLMEAESIRQSEENVGRILLGQELGVKEAEQYGVGLAEQYQQRSGYYSQMGNRAVESAELTAMQSGIKGVASTYNIGRTYQWW